MLSVREITQNAQQPCASCGKIRKRSYEIRVGFPGPARGPQNVTALPLCRSCIRRLHAGIENRCGLKGESAPDPLPGRPAALPVEGLEGW